MTSATDRPVGATGAASEFRLGGDLSINRLGLGAMRLAQTGWGGPARNPDVGCMVLRRAVELGVTHIDTADYYRSADGAVRANSLIRQALYPYPSRLVIATKVGPILGPDGTSPAPAAGLRALVEANLESLGLERLDLVYLRIGRMTPPHGESLAERFEALAALREEGLVRHLGLSNVDADHLAEARAIATVSAVQNHFSIAERDETAMLEACAAHDIAFVPFGPIGSGRADLSDARLASVAAHHGATASQIALAWLLTSSPVTLAIPGTGSLAHLEENFAAGSIVLSSDDLANLGTTRPRVNR